MVRIDEITDAFRSIVEGLGEARQEINPGLKKTLEKWAKNTADDAGRLLDRPGWLLSQNITSKTQELGQGEKLWAMAGFRFSKSDDKRSPGYYGQFHEAGWLPNQRKPTARPHFLRDAKKKNMPQLEQETNNILKEFKEVLLLKIKKSRKETGGTRKQSIIKP